MTGVIKVSWLFFSLLLFSTVVGKAQKKIKPEEKTDSIIITAPKVIVNNDCRFGIATLSLDTALSDSAQKIKKISLYKKRENIDFSDTLADTLTKVKVLTLKDLEQADNIIIPENEGTYTIQYLIEVNEKLKPSPFSKFVTLLHCSIIKFNSVFNKAQETSFTPSKLVNIQITEFSIFDRVGETVYTHNNNTVSWNGKYLNGKECPNGVYYYYCKYKDIAENSAEKSLSGMIELKNAAW
jgi:gliding motility-associated-like protein